VETTGKFACFCLNYHPGFPLVFFFLFDKLVNLFFCILYFLLLVRGVVTLNAIGLLIWCRYLPKNKIYYTCNSFELTLTKISWDSWSFWKLGIRIIALWLWDWNDTVFWQDEWYFWQLSRHVYAFGLTFFDQVHLSDVFWSPSQFCHHLIQ